MKGAILKNRKIGRRERKKERKTEGKRLPALAASLRYDNISLAPGKHCRRSPEGTLPKLAAASFVGDSSTERKRWPGTGGRSRKVPLLFFSLVSSPSLARSPRETRNTKQNRMLLGFCRAPLKPPYIYLAVPCRAVPSDDTSRLPTYIPRGYY